MKNVKAQAALKIREAMSGLREAMKTASSAERRTIHACMCDLRTIKNELAAADAAEAEEAAPAMEVVDESDDTIENDIDAPVDGDEELALSALELAAAALKAAAEEDGEEEAEEEEPAEEEPEEEEAEEEEPAEEEPEEEAEEEEEPEEEAEEEEEPEEEPAEEPESDGTDVDALTDEEIAALEAEGLLEGSAIFKRPVRRPIRRPAPKPVRASSVEARLARVQSRLNTLLAMDDDMGMEEEVLDEEPMEGGEDDMSLLDEEEAELTPEEIAMLEEMGIGLEASTMIIASSNVLWAARKRKKATEAQKKKSAAKWKGAKLKGRTAVKKTKKGKFYITVYRIKGNKTGHYNLFYKKKPIFKAIKAPKGASKAVTQQIAKHNLLVKAKLVKESPFAAKKKAPVKKKKR